MSEIKLGDILRAKEAFVVIDHTDRGKTVKIDIGDLVVVKTIEPGQSVIQIEVPKEPGRICRMYVSSDLSRLRRA